eukprot:jgi/Botrbrau1/4375/Bobra.105_2s0021.1
MHDFPKGGLLQGVNGRMCTLNTIQRVCEAQVPFKSAQISKHRKLKCVVACSSNQRAPDTLICDSNRRSISRREALTVATAGLVYQFLDPRQVPRAQATSKKENLSIEELKDIIVKDFQDKQYYITGNLSPEIFEDDCVFTDPTTRVTGTETYANAVKVLFDPETSRADLISVQVEDPHHLLLKWRFDAALNVPGKPRFKPYTGSTLYTTNDQGLIFKHEETWDISPLEAVISVFFPEYGTPPAPPVK